MSKTIFLDIETSPCITATFSLYPDSIHHSNILQDWYIICVCWKELGKEKVHSISTTTPGDDLEVVKKIGEVIAGADIIVGHNLKKFDQKKIVSRLVYHRLPPLPQIPIVDTLTEIKKVSVQTSHRLDYLGKHLLGHGKQETSEGMWLRALKGDKSAVKEMVSYCKVDVLRLEELYLLYKPYFKSHPHIGVLNNLPKETCPKCSSDCVKDGIRITAAGLKRQEYKCKSCGGYHSIPFKQTK
jgi:hypothetical protein